MACNYKDLLVIKKFWDEGVVPKKPKIMELGSNDLNVHDAATIQDLILKFGGKTNGLNLSNNSVFPARVFYEALGWEYYCLDIDNRPGTLDIDLNAGNVPSKFSGYFDLVTNHGTTEHVCNPIGSFFCIHTMTKTNGLMIHDTPLFGLGNHGFINLTPKFWHSLMVFNHYECLTASVRDIPFDPKQIDPANFYLPHFDFIENLKPFSGNGQIINIILKKQREEAFIPPMDLWESMSDRAMLKTLFLGATSFSEGQNRNLSQTVKAVNKFFKSSRAKSFETLQWHHQKLVFGENQIYKNLAKIKKFFKFRNS